MPVMDGNEASTIIKVKNPSLNIAQTAFADTMDEVIKWQLRGADI